MSDSYFRVLLPNGQNVNIATQEGANAFLENGKSDFIIRTNLPDINAAREKLAKARSNAERQSLQEQLYCSYALFTCIADTASSDVFERHVSKKDLRALVDHSCGVFSELADTETWKKTVSLRNMTKNCSTASFFSTSTRSCQNSLSILVPSWNDLPNYVPCEQSPTCLARLSLNQF